MISLRNVSARAGNFELVDISFDIPAGGYGVVIGPAGAGKTTLLETIAGIVKPTAGHVLLGGRDVTRRPPEARRSSIVYQHAYLFPHLDVRRNIEYGAVSREAAEEASHRFELDALADRSVGVLSGGERQLVAIARALARRPEVLLLDEPFSALDPRTRNVVRRLLRAVYHERRLTVLQVTHDFTEAGLLGDVAILLDKGRVLQQGSPEEVFRKPSSPYIADFLGAENVFAGVVRPAAANAGESLERAVTFTTGTLTLYALGDTPAGPAHAIVRAEEIALSTELSTSSVRNQFRGTIVEIARAGPLTRVTVDVSGTPFVAAVTTQSAHQLELTVGAPVAAAFKATAVHLC